MFFVLLCLSTPALASPLSPPIIDAIKDKHWHLALSASPDDLTKRYIIWRHLLDDDEADFSALWSFMREHKDWPQLNRLRIKAERDLFQQPKPDGVVSEYFASFPPISGYGKLALVRAGRKPADQLVAEAWVDGDFTAYDEELIRAEFGAFLRPALHHQRTERLLKERNANAAERMLRAVSEEREPLYRTRIALQQNKSNLDKHIRAIPASLRNDPGLLADRTIWRHRKGITSGAEELLRQMKPTSAYADAVWRIRAAYARDYIEDAQYDKALALLESAGSNLSASNAATHKWMVGWLEYAFKNRPRKAYEPFVQLYHTTSYPISRARGAYWAGRAATKNQNPEIAAKWYTIAAKYPTTFYGQLAQHQLSPGKAFRLPTEPNPDASLVNRYKQHPFMQLSARLTQSGLSAQAVPFILKIADDTSRADHLASLAEAARQLNLPFAQVRVAKIALRENIILSPHGWPSFTPPESIALEPSLAFAIARQESEFNPQAISHANAMGLMQLLPATGKKVARELGMEFNTSDLFIPEINVKLGSQYLANLVDGFGGSYILAIAGYNAGPGRSREWTSRFGEPGANLEQTIQWLEMIPFAETRNYVQRVLEHRQIYHSFTNPDAPPTLVKDLLR